MPAASRSPLLLLVVALVLLVAADVVRRTLAPTGAARAPSAPVAAPVGTTAQGGLAEPADDSTARALRRAEVLARMAEEGAGTYLADMVGADSLLRRWPDERRTRPLRVATVRAGVDGYREEFAGNVTWSMLRWNGALPVPLEAWADSASADIVVTWTARLDSNRTGRTDVTWDGRGIMRRAVVVLATHLPDGRSMDGAEMTAVALHELGHAVGLNHSSVPGDALYTRTRAIELSERDRRTVRLLYALPPGSLR